MSPAVPASRILLVDDDAEIRSLLRTLLESEGYTVSEAGCGEDAVALVASAPLDLIILDVMMPGMDGYAACSAIRSLSNVPILFLTAKTQDSDLTMGYSCGGDDYLSKPFSFAELLARVKGLLRRYQVYKGKCTAEGDGCLHIGGLRVHRTRNEVFRRGEEIQLTEIEVQLFRLMLTHRGKIFSAQNLYESIWNEPYLSTSANTVMVHIRKLRSKLEEDPQNPRIIKTIWGKGYRIE